MREAPDTVLAYSLAIPLLPSSRFKEAGAVIQRVADKYTNEWKNVHLFTKYLRRTWLACPSKVSVNGMPLRTNNAVERYNRTLRNKMGSHPRIFKFLSGLSKRIEEQEIDVERLSRGVLLKRPTPKKTQSRNKLIKLKSLALKSEKLNVESFLKAFYKPAEDICYECSLDFDENEDVQENEELTSEDLILLDDIDYDLSASESDEEIEQLANLRKKKRKLTTAQRTKNAQENDNSEMADNIAQPLQKNLTQEITKGSRPVRKCRIVSDEKLPNAKKIKYV